MFHVSWLPLGLALALGIIVGIFATYRIKQRNKKVPQGPLDREDYKCWLRKEVEKIQGGGFEMDHEICPEPRLPAAIYTLLTVETLEGAFREMETWSTPRNIRSFGRDNDISKVQKGFDLYLAWLARNLDGLFSDQESFHKILRNREKGAYSDARLDELARRSENYKIMIGMAKSTFENVRMALIRLGFETWPERNFYRLLDPDL